MTRSPTRSWLWCINADRPAGSSQRRCSTTRVSTPAHQPAGPHLVQPRVAGLPTGRSAVPPIYAPEPTFLRGQPSRGQWLVFPPGGAAKRRPRVRDLHQELRPWHRGSAARQYLCHGQSRTTTRSRPATATPAPETVVFVTTDSPSSGQDLRHELRLVGDGPQPRRHFCHGRSRTRRVVRVSVPPHLDSGALPDDGAVPHRAGRPAHRLVTRSVGPLRHPDTRWGASSCCRPQAPRPYRPALPARRRPRR